MDFDSHFNPFTALNDDPVTEESAVRNAESQVVIPYYEPSKLAGRKTALIQIQELMDEIGYLEVDALVPYVGVMLFDRYYISNDVEPADIKLLWSACLRISSKMRGDVKVAQRIEPHNELEDMVQKVKSGLHKYSLVTPLYFISSLLADVKGYMQFKHPSYHHWMCLQYIGDVEFTAFTPSQIAAATFMPFFRFLGAGSASNVLKPAVRILLAKKCGLVLDEFIRLTGMMDRVANWNTHESIAEIVTFADVTAEPEVEKPSEQVQVDLDPKTKYVLSNMLAQIEAAKEKEATEADAAAVERHAKKQKGLAGIAHKAAHVASSGLKAATGAIGTAAEAVESVFETAKIAVLESTKKTGSSSFVTVNPPGLELQWKFTFEDNGNHHFCAELGWKKFYDEWGGGLPKDPETL